MFDDQTVRRLEAIGRLGFINPFGEERRALEALILATSRNTSSE